jgi:cytochrome P450
MTELDGAEAALTLFSPEVAADPHPTYARLRDECPVARGDLGEHSVVLLSRYEDVLWALRHPDAFTSAGGNLNLGEQPLLPLEVDPPQHTAYRRILNPQFVPREINKLEQVAHQRPPDVPPVARQHDPPRRRTRRLRRGGSHP